MCGIFGQISQSKINRKKLDKLVKHSEQRGVDSSGLIYNNNNKYKIYRADYNIKKLIKSVMPYDSNIVLGHSRLITNGLNDNQPVVRGDICVIHNGIITNEKNIWDQLSVERKYQIDSEVIVAIAEEHLKNDGKISEIQKKVFSLCKGIIACALVLPNKGKLVLFSNNGSLYAGYLGSDIYFASENYSLYQIGCSDIKQIKENSLILDIPTTDKKLSIIDDNHRIENLIPEFKFHKSEEKLLEYAILNLKRCTKCILPETMPFIIFDEEGVCNYCHNYQMKNIAKPKEELFKLVESYRKKGDIFDCIVPFSGGRDSSYGLHLIVNEF